LGKHGVIEQALGYYLPARQFLPGALLINGVQILVLVSAQRFSANRTARVDGSMR
jgi:hypothetical protein